MYLAQIYLTNFKIHIRLAQLIHTFMSEGINTGFGFSKNAPLPTEAIVNAIKSAGSHNSIPNPSGMPSVMPSGQSATQNANATSNSNSITTSTAR